MTDVPAVTARIEREGAFLRDVRREVETVIVGQRALLDGLLTGLLVDGHVLLEGVPGLAKSLAVQSLAAAVGGAFRRIQFTPDLLPSDLVGTQVYDARTGALIATTPGSEIAGAIAWSPDGEALAAMVSRRGKARSSSTVAVATS